MTLGEENHKIKRTKTILGENIKNFIYANSMTRQDFADLLNQYLQDEYYEKEECKIYTANDIGTFDSRGSIPNDPKCLIEISNIIGLPLEELFASVFPIEELKCTGERLVLKNTDGTFPYKENITSIRDLPPKDKEFIYDLLENTQQNEENNSNSNKIFCTFMIGLKYDSGKKVRATIFCGEDFKKEYTVEWDWIEYGKKMNIYDDESIVMEIKFCKYFLDKLLYKLRIIKNFDFDFCNYSDLPKDNFGNNQSRIYQEKMDGYLIGEAIFEKNKENNSIFLAVAKKKLDRARKEFDRIKQELQKMETIK